MQASQIPNAGLRSRKTSNRLNEKDFGIVFESNSFSYRLRWDWADIPQPVVGQQICGIVTDKDGISYASSRVKGYAIMKFSPDGKLLDVLGKDLPCGRPHGLTVDEHYLYLADDGVHVIFQLDKKTGELVKTWGNYKQPSDTGINNQSAVESRLRFWTIKRLGEPFNRPTRLIRDSKGFYYASDGYGNAAVHKFDPEGNHLLTWGGMGPEPGHFGIPHSIWVDPKDRIWIADREFDRCQLFDRDGNLLKVIDKLLYPYDMVSDDQYMYISEREGRITIMDMDLNIVSQIGFFGSMLNGHSISVDPKGNLYLGLLDGPYRLLKLERIHKEEKYGNNA